MGRIGISEYQVFQAADQLAADGVQPSVDTVRVELGNTGSRTTINKYLKAWRERRAHREAAGANLSGHLRQVITEQAEILLSVLEAESSSKLQIKSQEFENSRLALNAEIQRLEQAHEQTLKELQELRALVDDQSLQLRQKQSQIDDLREQNQAQREALAKELGRRELSERAISDRDKQLAAASKELANSRARNEILGESLAVKTTELQRVQRQERDHRTSLKERNEEIKRLTREAASTRKLSEKELARLSQSIEKLTGGHQTRPVKKRIVR